MDTDDDDDVPLSLLKHSQRELQQEMEHKQHCKKLSKLLKANQLKKIDMPQDGDCIFSAISYHTGCNAKLIRLMCSKHITENVTHYNPFTELLPESLHDLTKMGNWNTDLGDIVLLAIANMLQRNIIIFSSRLSVIEIRPTLALVPVLNLKYGSRLLLAHLAIQGHEHYDVVGTVSFTCYQPILMY